MHRSLKPDRADFMILSHQTLVPLRSDLFPFKVQFLNARMLGCSHHRQKVWTRVRPIAGRHGKRWTACVRPKQSARQRKKGLRIAFYGDITDGYIRTNQIPPPSSFRLQTFTTLRHRDGQTIGAGPCRWSREEEQTEQLPSCSNVYRWSILWYIKRK